MSEINKKALEQLNKLSFDGDDDSGVAESFGSGFTRDFRNSDFFSSRYGDDDFPEFTGKKKVLELAHRAFSSDVLEEFKLEVDDQEKSWFTLYLRKK